MAVARKAGNNKKTLKVTNQDIRDIVRGEIAKDKNVDLNHIDVSEVTNMTYLFLNRPSMEILKVGM